MGVNFDVIFSTERSPFHWPTLGMYVGLLKKIKGRPFLLLYWNFSIEPFELIEPIQNQLHKRHERNKFER